MVELVMQFFQLSGMTETPPSTLGELIPYLVTLAVALVLVSGVFAAIGRLFVALWEFRR